MSNLQPNCCLKFDFQKVDQYAGFTYFVVSLLHEAIGMCNPEYTPRTNITTYRWFSASL